MAVFFRLLNVFHTHRSLISGTSTSGPISSSLLAASFPSKGHWEERLVRGGGSACSLVPLKKLEFLPCSPKISQDFPLNSLLLSSPVPRNSIACSLDPQKYSLMFPKIPNILQFFMTSYFHNFYLAIHNRDNHSASVKCLFRLLEECCVTSCILAEMYVDSLRVRPSASKTC